MKPSKEVANYIATFPPETQAKMEQLRACITKAAPKAEECWSYQMPAYKQEGMLVYFAAYKNHIGFYPTSSGIINFQKEISAYKNSKGAIQFPLDKPIPLGLVTKIVKHRIEVNLQKAATKNLKTCSKGHTFIKSSDCPTCPICEQERKPKEGFMSLLSAPARRALEGAGIETPKQLAKHTKFSILKLHGMGPASIPVLEKALKENGLSFKAKS